MSDGMGTVDVARMARAGVTSLSTKDALALFDAARDVDAAVLAPVAAVGTPVAAALAPARVDATVAPLGVFERLAGLPAEERDRMLLDLVRTHAAAVLGHRAPGAIDIGRSFKELGFDSLTGVELSNRLTASAGVRLPAGVVFDYPTPVELAHHLHGRLVPDQPAAAPGLAELDRLEAVLSRIPADDDGRHEVTRRLQALLAQWQHVAAPAGVDVVHTARTATVDELLDFIDRELA